MIHKPAKQMRKKNSANTKTPKKHPKTTARHKHSLCCWKAKQEAQIKVSTLSFFSIILQIYTLWFNDKQ